MSIFGREPVALMEVIRTGILCGVLFGLPLTDVQQAAILIFAGAVMTFITRTQVTPVSAPVVPVNVTVTRSAAV